MTKEKPWYDPFVRFPDFFAGTLASMDRETGAAKKRKHNVLIEEIFANNPQYNIIRVEMSRDNWRFSFRSIEKSEGPQVSMSRAKNVFE